MGRCMMRARHEGGYGAVTSEGSAGFSDGCQACQRRARRTMVVVRRIESGMSGMSGMGKRLLSHPCHRCRCGRSGRRGGAGLRRQQGNGQPAAGRRHDPRPYLRHDDTTCTVLLENNACRLGPGQTCGRRPCATRGRGADVLPACLVTRQPLQDARWALVAFPMSTALTTNDEGIACRRSISRSVVQSVSHLPL
jgi:hypothetical protein